jgi:hypothetical protein
LGLFIQRLNPRAKTLGPNQNKNAQIQLVKLSKQRVFVKVKNVSDKKIRSCYFTFDKNTLFRSLTFIISIDSWAKNITKRLQRATNYFFKLDIISLRVKASLFVLFVKIETKLRSATGRSTKRPSFAVSKMSYNFFFLSKNVPHSNRNKKKFESVHETRKVVSV